MSWWIILCPLLCAPVCARAQGEYDISVSETDLFEALASEARLEAILEGRRDLRYDPMLKDAATRDPQIEALVRRQERQPILRLGEGQPHQLAKTLIEGLPAAIGLGQQEPASIDVVAELACHRLLNGRIGGKRIGAAREVEHRRLEQILDREISARPDPRTVALIKALQAAW